MFEKIKKSRTMQIVLIVLSVVILISIFTPRGNNPVLTAGLKVDARLGSLRGGINLETFESNSASLVLFHAPWCGHCKRLMPEFNKFKDSYKGNVKIAAVDCDANKEVAEKHNIQGFPTIRYYEKGTSLPSKFVEFSGPRTASGLNDFINKVHGVIAQAPDNAASV